jgi:hypothetical protein
MIENRVAVIPELAGLGEKLLLGGRHGDFGAGSCQASGAGGLVPMVMRVQSPLNVK